MTAPAPYPVSALGRKDAPWVALVAVSFALGLAITWQRWGNPLIDCPREMDQPLRLLRGERLYSDVRHLYGPLAPCLNAILYRCFGPSLAVLYAAGAISTAILLGLVYRVARRFLAPAAAAAATSIVLWTCALNPNGTYVLPYAYASTYGCVLGLVTLELILSFVERGSGGFLIAAGIAAGLATLAKTEMGLVAVAIGFLAVLASPFPRGLLVRFALPAAAVVVLGYGPIVARVGWRPLALETFILPLPGTLPPELVYFNRLISGLNEPLPNLYRTILGAIRLALVGGLVVAAAVALARVMEPRSRRRIYALSVGLLALAAVVVAILQTSHFFRRLHWEDGILRGTPLILVVVLAVLATRWVRERSAGGLTANTLGLIALSGYAAASLVRIPLRASADTVYAATLLPPSIIVITWLATSIPFAILREARQRRLASHLTTALLFAYALSAAALDARVYRMQELGTIRSELGTMKAPPDLADAFDAAIAFVLAETRVGEPVAVVPEGTSINFLTDRPNPLREESIHPGILDAKGELDAIARLEARGVRLVLIANRSTWMYGKPVFGTDYCTKLMAWIEERFEPVATFGRGATAASQLGDQTFFIRAYRRRDARS